MFISLFKFCANIKRSIYMYLQKVWKSVRMSIRKSVRIVCTPSEKCDLSTWAWTVSNTKIDCWQYFCVYIVRAHNYQWMMHQKCLDWRSHLFRGGRNDKRSEKNVDDHSNPHPQTATRYRQDKRIETLLDKNQGMSLRIGQVLLRRLNVHISASNMRQILIRKDVKYCIKWRGK
jgi:hypothetical protein